MQVDKIFNQDAHPCSWNDITILSQEESHHVESPETEGKARGSEKGGWRRTKIAGMAGRSVKRNHKPRAGRTYPGRTAASPGPKGFHTLSFRCTKSCISKQSDPSPLIILLSSSVLAKGKIVYVTSYGEVRKSCKIYLIFLGYFFINCF